MDNVGCASFEDVLGNLNDMVEDLKTICHIQDTSHANNNGEEIRTDEQGELSLKFDETNCCFNSALLKSVCC